MKRKSAFYIILALLVIFTVSGCGTAKKKVNIKEEVSTIKTKLESVESKLDTVEAKQTEAERIAAENAQAIEELKSAKERMAPATNIGINTARTFRSNERVKDIQVCLKNAGFYKGKIDGRKGRGTRRAIKGFQKMNGLRADGIVGPRTWELLSKYQSSAAPASGEMMGEGTTK